MAMGKSEDEECLLAKGDADGPYTGCDVKSQGRLPPISIITLCVLFILSLLLNLYFLFPSNSLVRCVDHGESPYSEHYFPLVTTTVANEGRGKNTFDTLVSYHSTTKYWDPGVNRSIADEAWDALDTDPIAVALHDDFASNLGLPESTPFPWDTERSIYYVKAYHDLHCLVCIHPIFGNHR